MNILIYSYPKLFSIKKCKVIFMDLQSMKRQKEKKNNCVLV